MPLLGRKARFSLPVQAAGTAAAGWVILCCPGTIYGALPKGWISPKIVARGYCRSSIGPVSGLPVLRLAPVKEQRNNCPFLDGGRCAIHDAEPLVCTSIRWHRRSAGRGAAYFCSLPSAADSGWKPG